jgi:nucleoside-diphosphate-sugar epimerase
MKIFITGATGVLGRVVTRLLVDGGYNVSALARNAHNQSQLRDAGAESIRADLFDAAALRSALQGRDTVLHLATRIPRPEDATRPNAWRENDRIRNEGTRNLVDAALECGVKTFIYPGIVFMYRDGGDSWLDVSAPTQPTPILQSSLNAEAEVNRFTSGGGRGIVLRMGGFYGPTAPSSEQMLRSARRGIATVFGRADAYHPLIWVDDAALAVIDALRGAPAGIYNIVDDDPLQRSEFASQLAKAVGRKRLLRLPTFFLWLFGGKNVMFLARSQRVSNRRFKEATGWSPMFPSAREGLKLLTIQP